MFQVIKQHTALLKKKKTTVMRNLSQRSRTFFCAAEDDKEKNYHKHAQTCPVSLQDGPGNISYSMKEVHFWSTAHL